MKNFIKNNGFYLLFLVLSYLAILNVIEIKSYFSYWSQRDMIRGLEMNSVMGLDNWFLGAELSFGSGSRIIGGFNNIITFIILQFGQERTSLLIGQFILNILLILIASFILWNNNNKKVAIIFFPTVLISPLFSDFISTYWNPGLIPGFLSIVYAALVSIKETNKIDNKISFVMFLSLLLSANFHLSSMFIMPIVIIILWKKNYKDYIFGLMLAILIIFFPYLIYEISNNFINSKLLLDQINVSKSMIFITISSFIVFLGLFTKNNKIGAIGAIALIFTIVATNYERDEIVSRATINEFISLENKEYQIKVNNYRLKAIESKEDFNIIGSYVNEKGTTVNYKIEHTKNSNDIFWQFNEKNYTKDIINLKNIKGFLINTLTLHNANGKIKSLIFTVFLLISIIIFLISKSKQKSILIFAFLLPLTFFLTMNEVDLTKSYNNRYLGVSYIAMAMIFSIAISELFGLYKLTTKKSQFFLLVSAITISIFYIKNIEENSFGINAKVKSSIPNDTVILANTGYEPVNQLVADFNYDNSDNNLYDLDSKKCYILHENGKDLELPIKYDINGFISSAITETVKKKKINYEFPMIKKETTIDGQCTSNLQNRYVLSQKDKQMFNYFYLNNVKNKQNYVDKINDNEYYVNIKDVFCVNNCINILMNIVFDKEGIKIYSNQLKLQSYNKDFFESGTLDKFKVILTNKETKEEKEILLTENTLGYTGLHSPYIKKLNYNWENYDIKIKFIQNKKHHEIKGLIPKESTLSLTK